MKDLPLTPSLSKLHKFQTFLHSQTHAHSLTNTVVSGLRQKSTTLIISFYKWDQSSMSWTPVCTAGGA